MADLSIRHLDDDVKQRLRQRAADHGRSMEAEIRAILTESVRDGAPPANPFTRLHELFAEVGGLELEPRFRDAAARVPDLNP